MTTPETSNWWCPLCVRECEEEELEKAHNGFGDRFHTVCGNYVLKRSANEPLSELEQLDKTLNESLSVLKLQLGMDSTVEKESPVVKELGEFLQEVLVGTTEGITPMGFLQIGIDEVTRALESEAPIPLDRKEVLVKTKFGLQRLRDNLTRIGTLIGEFNDKRAMVEVPAVDRKCEICGSTFDHSDEIFSVCSGCGQLKPKGLVK